MRRLWKTVFCKSRVSSDDCPWWTTDLQELHRKKQRLYRKERKSLRWSILEKRFQAKIKLSKKLFYSRMVEDLIEKDQNQWYSQLKRLTNQGKSEEIVVDEINNLTDPQQAETIADNISSKSQEYDHLKNEDITIPYFTKSTIPHIRVTEVEEKIMMIKKKKSIANGDIPAKLIKVAAESIAIPLTNVINASIKLGQWPNIYKLETITPVPKVRPSKSLDELRPISNLFTYCKIGEKIICEMIVEDMVEKMDPFQFGNLKNTSIQHYLVSLVHMISSVLDRNSKGDIFAACVTVHDYCQAFSRQCHKLGIQSFIQNGVRPSLIPLLVNYFQGRQCQIKWRGQLSSKRDLPGSGAQGSVLGNWEYLSQTNNNANHIPVEDKWKWVDDLTTLEIINLIAVGLASYNFRQHLPSDIPVHGQYVKPENLKTQEYITTLDTWSGEHKMKLNAKKTKILIFNFTKKYQFATRLTLKGTVVEQVPEAKILGTIIDDQLSWDKNTSRIIKKCYMRMQLLRKVASFGTSPQILRQIYIQIIRVILEGSCQVWDGGLTIKNRRSLERVQKLCLWTILPNKTYKEALRKLDIEDLQTRRTKLMLRFAKLNKTEGKLSHLFTPNRKIHNMETRYPEKYVTRANTDRFMKSPIIQMQKLLNNIHK